MLRTIQLSHMPPDLALYLALYHDVKNAAYLRQQLLDGNEAFEYAFIDASMILSETHILAAAFRAMNDYLHERLKSRNIHSEIVFALSPNNNIGEAFRKFGISGSTTDLLVIKISTSPSVTAESVGSHLGAAVEGTALDFNNESLRGICDLSKIKKTYKIASLPPLKEPSKQAKPQLNGDCADKKATKDRKELETAVLGAIALRGAT